MVLERARRDRASWRGRYDRLRLNSTPLVLDAPGGRVRPRHGHLPVARRGRRLPRGLRRDNALDVRLSTQSSASTATARLGRAHLGRRLRGRARGRRRPATSTRPFVPDWPGRERFRGALLHAAELPQPRAVPRPRRAGRRARAARAWRSPTTSPRAGRGGCGSRCARRRTSSSARRSAPAARARADARAPAARRPRRELRALQGGRRPDRVRPAGARGGVVHPPAPPGVAPAIVDKVVIEAIRERRIEIVAGVESLDETGVDARRRRADRARRGDRRHRLPPRPRADRRPPRRARRRTACPRGRRRGGRARPALRRLRAHRPRSCATAAARRRRAAKAIAGELRARPGQATSAPMAAYGDALDA